jgi:hypothetical protein
MNLFEHTFYINLDRREDRLQSVLSYTHGLVPNNVSGTIFISPVLGLMTWWNNGDG